MYYRKLRILLIAVCMACSCFSLYAKGEEHVFFTVKPPDAADDHYTESGSGPIVRLQQLYRAVTANDADGVGSLIVPGEMNAKTEAVVKNSLEEFVPEKMVTPEYMPNVAM
ncbi:MAG: hypothetical protein EOM20_03005 [Spartobacteria bacterium]|nr:hypothetical protein [Spartobacteria bacterium]